MRQPPHSFTAKTQCGAALLLFVIALVMAASLALLKRLNQAPDQVQRDNFTMQQLKRARDALRGYALSGIDPVNTSVQPGRLPCPDYTLDGDSDPCITVSGHIQPGRLPWRTLGLEELRDAGNEPLWYVPALEFTDGQTINSNSTTTLRIDAGARAEMAIVLSPGPVIAKQKRPTGNLSAQRDPSRYFEDINALAATDYVTKPATPGSEFNDRLLALHLDQFMPQLERRVLNELRNTLKNTLKSASALPNPAAINTTDCNNTLTEGLLPETINAATPCDVDVTKLPSYPPWFSAWQPLIWYVMSPGSTLTVGSATNLQALIFSPGAPMPGQNRLSPTGASDLLEGTENTNGPDIYETPVNSATNNDQLRIVAP